MKTNSDLRDFFRAADIFQLATFISSTDWPSFGFSRSDGKHFAGFLKCLSSGEGLKTVKEHAADLNTSDKTLQRVLAKARAVGAIESIQVFEHGGPRKQEIAWELVYSMNPAFFNDSQAIVDNRNGSQPAKEKKKRSQLAKPLWDENTLTLSLGEASCTIAKQAKQRIAALNKFERENWPNKIATTCPGNPQSHHDTIRALNKCEFLQFSSASNGTDIAWENA